ncbi:hypothetical protein [[Limnothrix rosea] IAM M-220]|uniref:hypothetical protein n=1 Tax=[Limnothrix rosea] IAM M-220 TaxID=454133 RepID=UPI000962D650|nr:hypothetical protein [[Limnothrix rosea] IAM M-220]OKH19573.1 hypothetical protein NIES208_01865 [[Limnothrix rosea] IAM M-220]
MPQYQVGQRWSYQARAEDQDSTLIIGAIEIEPAIVHIIVEKVMLTGLGESMDICHLPFAEAALNNSVTDLLEENVAVDSSFTEGLATWTAQQGGVFQLSVAEAIATIANVTQTSANDTFDAIVKRMEAEQSPETIRELYRNLFALEEWFFLCRSDSEETPVQLQFEMNGGFSQAVLAFTSAEKAIAAADKLNLYPDGADIRLMPADIDKAIIWLDSEACQCEWVCFNLTHKHFPLYVADAVRMNLKR